jgi:hypothetical protein
MAMPKVHMKRVKKEWNSSSKKETFEKKDYLFLLNIGLDNTKDFPNNFPLPMCTVLNM